jgi:putative FmdB family regulatory protein
LDIARQRFLILTVPIQRYVPAAAPCRLCGDGFDHRQSPSEADLCACPTCGQAVRRVGVQAVNTPKILKPLSISDAKSQGFTVFKKSSSGEYERQ